MFDYGVVSSYAPSLRVVSQDIAYALERHGRTANAYTYIVPWFDAQFRRAIIFIPFDPLILSPWVMTHRDYVDHGIPSVIYVTVEGVPKQHLIDDWWVRDGVFVANSRFTFEMLCRVGVKPIAVVHHGVNLDAVNSITVDKQSVKKQLKARVLFGTVASELPRKGLDRLAKAISLASPKTPDAKFVILTTARGATHFRGLSNTYVRVEFGKLDRSSILGLIASFDYYVCSSLAEGFGLPLLEAQAFGVPCIYPEYQPLTEVAHPAANFTVGVSGEGYEDHGQGILYLMHYYSVEELAQRIVEAYEICICDPDEYNERSRQVREHAKQFDAVKTYSWFVR